jgi:hypothetical protein
MSNTTPPGWYPDSQVPGQTRYWDGQQWTEHVAPAAPNAPLPLQQDAHVATGDAPKKHWVMRHKVLTIVLALIVLSGVSSALSGGSDDESARDSPAAVADSDTDAESPPEAEAVADPDTEADPEPEPVDTDGDGANDEDDVRPEDPKIQTEDDIDTDGDGVADYQDDFPKNAEYSKDTDGDTVPDALDAFPKDAEYSKDTDGDRVADAVDAFPSDPSRSEISLAMENALESAEDYLDYTAFSRLGLIDQLSSEYGEGFDLADATWAVDQLRVDWNEQAVKSGRQYLDFSSFSRQGLIDQLSSQYGEQFTVAQATYAVNKIGL